MSITESAPPTPSSASESPEASSSTLPSTSLTSSKSRPAPSSTEGPPRKRSRTDLTPEERKEARAHRNRIAAQNSRDKRKAQFATLERRIAELEEENRTLRASMGLTALRETEEQRAADHAREQENRELRERVRTLEAGWDAIVKALQTHGVPPGIPGLISHPQTTQTPTPFPEDRSTSSSTPPPSHTTTFPVLVPPSPIFPLSPAPSQSSMSTANASMFDEPETTRHLAAGGLDATQRAAHELTGLDLGIQAAVFGEQMGARSPAPADDIDEAAMEDLFREILAPSPTLSAGQISAVDGAAPSAPSAAVMHHGSRAEAAGRDYEREREAEAQAEMQRLLDMLPPVGDATEALPMDDQAKFDADFSSALNMDLGGWDFASAALSPGPRVF